MNAWTKLDRVALVISISMALVLAWCVLIQSTALVKAQPGDIRAQRAVTADRQSQLTSGKSLTVVMDTPVESLDPALGEFTGIGWLVYRQVYDTLVDHAPGGITLTPGLAQNWSSSADAITWTFELQPGITFHDGAPLDAAAVVTNFVRWWDSTSPYHVGIYDNFSVIFGGFKGDPDCLIADVRALDERHVQIVQSQRNGTLPAMLAMTSFSIASPNAIAAGTLVTHPVGTGAFQLASYPSTGEIRLARYANYWGGSGGIDHLNFIYLSNEADRLSAVLFGSAQVMPAISSNYVNTATSASNLNIVWKPSVSLGYLGLNNLHPPLDNVLVRKAIAHAINRTHLLNTYYNAVAPYALTATQFLPPSFWGRDPLISGYSYDPLLARSLLAQAGYTNGFESRLWYMPVTRSYFPQAQDMAQDIAQDLLEVGITVTLQTDDWSTYLTKVQNGELEIFMLGWYADYGHPDNFMTQILCGGSGLAFGLPDNTLCYLVGDARGQASTNVQDILYQSASRYIHENLPLLPVAHVRVAEVWSKNLGGVASGVLSDSFAHALYVNFRQYVPVATRD